MQQAFEYENRNIQSITQPMYGVVEGVLYGQNARVDELNTRILDRFQADAPLQPNLDFRPVSTKYAHFPIVDRRLPATEPLHKSSMYSYTPKTTFAPLGADGPSSFFRESVDTESQLRNQCFALQRGADQGVYVPSSNSDLYWVNMAKPSRVDPQPHERLFVNEQLYTNPKNVDAAIGVDRFHNHTRTQLRGANIRCADAEFQV